MSEEENKKESIPLEQENIDSKSTEVSIKEPEEIILPNINKSESSLSKKKKKKKKKKN